MRRSAVTCYPHLVSIRGALNLASIDSDMQPTSNISKLQLHENLIPNNSSNIPDSMQDNMQDNAHRCCVCLDSDVPLVSLCSEHYACDDDIRQMFQRAINSQTNYPPRCCDKQLPMEAWSFNHLLGAEFVKAYEIKEQEYAVPAPLRVYCANSACRAWVPATNLLSDRGVVCLKCDTVTCQECRDAMPSDQSHDCAGAEEDQEVLALCEKERCKRCPSCGILVELRDACNHMTCGYCNFQFCFLCLMRGPCTNNCPPYGEAKIDKDGYYLYSGYHKTTGVDRNGLNRRGTNGRLQYSHSAQRQPRRTRGRGLGLDFGLTRVERQEAFEAEGLRLISEGFGDFQAWQRARQAVDQLFSDRFSDNGMDDWPVFEDDDDDRSIVEGEEALAQQTGLATAERDRDFPREEEMEDEDGDIVPRRPEWGSEWTRRGAAGRNQDFSHAEEEMEDEDGDILSRPRPDWRFEWTRLLGEDAQEQHEVAGADRLTVPNRVHDHFANPPLPGLTHDEVPHIELATHLGQESSPSNDSGWETVNDSQDEGNMDDADGRADTTRQNMW